MAEVKWDKDKDVKWDKDKPTDTALDTAADAAVGFGTGLSLDFDDEISGAIHAVGKSMGLTKKGYTEGRDEYRDRKALGYERSPGMTTIGNIGGGVAGALATGGGSLEVQGARALAKAGGRIAAEGAIQGIGADETGTAGGMAENAAKGAGTAVATAGALRGLGRSGIKVVEAINPELQQTMVRKGMNQRLEASGQDPNVVKKEPGGIPGRVRRMDNQKIGTGLESTAEIRAQAERAFKIKDAERQGYIKRLDDEGATVSGPAMNQRYLKRAGELGGNDPVADKALKRKLILQARELEGKGKLQGQPAAPNRQGPLATPPAMVERRAVEQAATVPGVKSPAVDPNATRPGVKQAGMRARLGLEEEVPTPIPGGPLRGRKTTPMVRQTDPNTIPFVRPEATEPMGRAATAATAPEPPGVTGRVQAAQAAAPSPPPLPNAGQKVQDQARLIQAAKLREQASRVGHDSVVESQRNKLRNEGQDFAARGDIPFAQIDKKRAYYGRIANFTKDSEDALLRQGRHHDVSDAMHASAEHHEPGLGRSLREASSDEATAISAMEGADTKMINAGKQGGPRGLFNHGAGAAAAAVGYKVGGPAMAAPAYVAGVVGAKGLAGRANSAAALAYKHGAKAVGAAQRFTRPLARAMKLANAPAASGASKAVVSAAMRVARARTPEEQAKEHYTATMGNNVYRKVVMQD